MAISIQGGHSDASGPPATGVTLGCLTNQIHYPLFVQELWLGVADAARANGANVICFAGQSLEEPSASFLRQANIAFDLVSPQRLDGLVVWSGAIGWHVGPDRMKRFLNRFAPLPTVSIETPFDQIPSILLDESTAVRELMRHLIQAHGYRRIAHIRGPKDHQGAQEIYHIYREALAEAGISINPALITPPDNWGQACGARMMSLLLDERNLRPPADFDAIVACDDDLACGAMSVLKARGFRIPADVAVAGHDDAREGRFHTPPLTTVHVPYYEMGWRAAEMALSLVRGAEVAERVVLPLRFVPRQSCGCPAPTLIQVEAAKEIRTTAPQLPLCEALTTDRAAMRASLEQAMRPAGPRIPADWAAQLLDALRAECAAHPIPEFLTTLEKLVDQAVPREDDLSVWHGVLSRLYHNLLPSLDSTTWPRIDRLLQQSRMLLGDIAQRVQAQKALSSEHQSQTIRQLSQALMTTVDLPELMNVLAAELPKLGIVRCALSIYDNPQMPTEWSRIVLAYDQSGRLDVRPAQRRFSSRLLTPERLIPTGSLYNQVVAPLYLREQQLGFLVFEVGPRQGKIYEALRREISTALQRALLMQRLQEHTRELTRYRDHLEDLVTDRTAELTRINLQLHEEILERGRVEHALRTSEEQYRLLAEHMKDGIVIVQAGQVIFANTAFSAITGSSPEQPDAAELAGVFDAPGLLGTWQQPANDESSFPTASCERELISTDGPSLWIEIEQRAIVWNGRPAALFTIRDITERKRREHFLEHKRTQLEEENLSLRSSIKERYKFGPLVGKSAAMQRVYELIVNAAASGMNVLITGESGTGKELVARTIHQVSRRKHQAFVPVNCASIPETLFEREFFGHRKGAFTGADRHSSGLFDRAHQGILFLDEVTELTPATQAKLLRVLQDGEYTPLGGTQPKQADVLIVAATNTECQAEIAGGRLRKDFYYRIGVIEIFIPPLRERKDDLPLLIEHILEKYHHKLAEEQGQSLNGLPVEQRMLPNQLVQALYAYSWPGNIRELENVLQRYLATRDLASVRKALGESSRAAVETAAEDFAPGTSLPEFMKAVEKQVIARAFAQNRFRTRATADQLGIPRRTLARKLKQYQVDSFSSSHDKHDI